MNKDIALQARKALEMELKRRNLPLSLLSLLMPQISVETAGFNSKLALQHNNISGMTWAKQPGAYNTGIKKPDNEAPGTYAGYDNTQAWASDYIGTLARNFPDSLKATNFADFAEALKKGKSGRQYYEATQADYLKALRSWIPQMSKLFPDINFKSAANIAAVVIIAAVALYFIIY